LQAGLSLSLLLLTLPTIADEADLLNAIAALGGHIDGSTPLSDGQIATDKQILDANSSIFGDTATSINASFGLVQAYEAQYGPMWSAGSPNQNGYRRRDVTGGANNWAMFQAVENI